MNLAFMFKDWQFLTGFIIVLDVGRSYKWGLVVGGGGDGGCVHLCGGLWVGMCVCVLRWYSRE
jgi:hypothetical protein